MKLYKVQATKNENDKKCMTIVPVPLSRDLKAIKAKLPKMGYPTADKLPARKWVEVALFDWDY